MLIPARIAAVDLVKKDLRVLLLSLWLLLLLADSSEEDNAMEVCDAVLTEEVHAG